MQRVIPFRRERGFFCGIVEGMAPDSVRGWAAGRLSVGRKAFVRRHMAAGSQGFGKFEKRSAEKRDRYIYIGIGKPVPSRCSKRGTVSRTDPDGRKEAGSHGKRGDTAYVSCVSEGIVRKSGIRS